jgi:hypothetical protein
MRKQTQEQGPNDRGDIAAAVIFLVSILIFTIWMMVTR